MGGRVTRYSWKRWTCTDNLNRRGAIMQSVRRLTQHDVRRFSRWRSDPGVAAGNHARNEPAGVFPGESATSDLAAETCTSSRSAAAWFSPSASRRPARVTGPSSNTSSPPHRATAAPASSARKGYAIAPASVRPPSVTHFTGWRDGVVQVARRSLRSYRRCTRYCPVTADDIGPKTRHERLGVGRAKTPTMSRRPHFGGSATTSTERGLLQRLLQMQVTDPQIFGFEQQEAKACGPQL